MKSIKSLYLATVVCCFISTTCENPSYVLDKNKEKESPHVLSEYSGKKKIRDFKGSVKDKNKSPIKAAIISIGNATTITDSNGDFIIKKANLNADITYIVVEKKGYENNVMSIVSTDSINEVTLVLKEESDLCLFWFCKHNNSLSNSNQ